MKTKPLLILVLSLFLSALPPSMVQADGIIIPEPPFPPEPSRPITQLEILYHHVNVTIDNQIAITHVDQEFYNPNEWAVEGTYVFPLPLDAVVQEFTLWVDGEPVQGEILDAEEARQIYEKIVQEMRDPAILEYVGRGAFQASIYPIQPNDKRRIELEYTQALTSDNGLIRYIYPLNTEKFSLQPLDSVKVSVNINSPEPIRAVYSSTHPIDILHDGDYKVTTAYEETDVRPDKDFALYYSIGESEAFHILSYRDPQDKDSEDGFFMLLLAPSPDEDAEVVAKDVLLVLDRSGSMEGEKFHQAQSALAFILNHLNPEDRFYMTAFSTATKAYSSHLLPAEEAVDALDWVERLDASGSTDINRALLETIAVADKERPTYLIFLTDGLPTEGITDSQTILTNFEKDAPDNIRLFAFGVGYDVDTFLLDSLSQEHHGLSTYVQPGEALDEILSVFYQRISTPILTNISLDFDDMIVYDLYPQPLPDLFAGSQVIVVGRYRQGGEADITLKGEVNGVEQTFTFSEQLFAIDNRGESDVLASLPRLWAARKIGYLQSSIRLNGPDQETINQIIQLSIRYGIVTPYTSYLVTEEMPLGVSNQENLAQDMYEEALSAPAMTYGRDAVEKAADEGALSQAEIAPAGEQYETVKNVWSRSFVLNESIWMDTTYDPENMGTVKIAFLSPEYFELVRTRADVAAALALGEHVIIIIDGQAYEITPDEPSDPDLILPQAVQSSSSQSSQDNPPQNPNISNNPDVNLPEPFPASGDTNIFLLFAGIGGVGVFILLILVLRGVFKRKSS